MLRLLRAKAYVGISLHWGDSMLWAADCRGQIRLHCDSFHNLSDNAIYSIAALTSDQCL